MKCSICQAPIRSGGARGLCAKHYKAARRAQDPRWAEERAAAQERIKERRREAELKRVMRRARVRVSTGSTGTGRARMTVQLFSDVHRSAAKWSWTETAEMLPAMRRHPCSVCGSPPTYGVCLICGPAAGVREPDAVSCAAPVVIVDAADLPSYFTGRLSHKRPKLGKIRRAPEAEA